MDSEIATEDKNVLLKIQNSRKPDQIIYLTLVKPDGRFRTRGLSHYFGVDEICIESGEVIQALPEYAEVLSFLFETMSEAQDLGLPYTYQSEFVFNGLGYTLHKKDDCRHLKRSSLQES
ncbi:MAG: hypothetical protein ABFD98_08600 [Syntrophobacteraceae bacterium]